MALRRQHARQGDEIRAKNSPASLPNVKRAVDGASALVGEEEENEQDTECRRCYVDVFGKNARELGGCRARPLAVVKGWPFCIDGDDLKNKNCDQPKEESPARAKRRERLCRL